MNDLEARFPRDTTVQISYLPALRGPAPHSFASFGSMYPAGVRGQRYLAATRPAEAAIEFRKVISRRGLVMEDPIDTVARLQVA